MEARKKRKHIQIAETRRKENGEPAAPEVFVREGPAKLVRKSTTEARARTATAPAQSAAVRHPAAAAAPVMNSGATAQPMLPATPCAEKACPSLPGEDRKSTRLNSSHLGISYAVFCLKKKT